MRPAMRDKIKFLNELQTFPDNELIVLTQTLEEIIRCRQVLKHMYVYDFYNKSVSELHQHQQQMLEELTDTLHEIIEKPLDTYLDESKDSRSQFYILKNTLSEKIRCAS